VDIVAGCRTDNTANRRVEFQRLDQRGSRSRTPAASSDAGWTLTSCGASPMLPYSDNGQLHFHALSTAAASNIPFVARWTHRGDVFAALWPGPRTVPSAAREMLSTLPVTGAAPPQEAREDISHVVVHTEAGILRFANSIQTLVAHSRWTLPP
jgi:hypothetical protein